jgi:DNA-binding LacI/PurR family transcriptional regulator
MRPDGPQTERRAAYLAHSREAGLEPSLIEVAPEDVDSSWGELLRDGVTALMIETVELADSVAHAAGRRSLSTPKDFSVVVLDVPARDAPAGAWSRMALPRREMGGAALQLLLARLDDPEVSVPVILPVTAPDRSTIGPPAQ